MMEHRGKEEKRKEGGCKNQCDRAGMILVRIWLLYKPDSAGASTTVRLSVSAVLTISAIWRLAFGVCFTKKKMLEWQL